MSRRSACPPGQRCYEPLAVLAYIAQYQQEHEGRSPSQRRIQRALAISAPSVVHAILHRLEQSRLLTITVYERGHPAHLSLTEAGQLAAQMWQEGQQGESTLPDEQ